MKTLQVISLVLTAGLLLAAQGAREAAVKKDLEKLRGTWRYESLVVEGTKADEDDFKNARLVCEGEKFTMNDGTATYRGTLHLDPAKKPRTIDVVFTDGPEKGKTSFGIYEVEGDTFKVCIGLAGKERPTEFVSKPGSGHVLEVLKREKR